MDVADDLAAHRLDLALAILHLDDLVADNSGAEARLVDVVRHLVDVVRHLAHNLEHLVRIVQDLDLGFIWAANVGDRAEDLGRHLGDWAEHATHACGARHLGNDWRDLRDLVWIWNLSWSHNGYGRFESFSSCV